MHLIMPASAIAADRDAWLAARTADADGEPRIGASDIGAIMALPGAYSGPRKLWLQKTGQWPDQPEPHARLEFGTYCENFACWLLARDQPGWHLTEGGMYASDERPWQTATFDRLMHPDSVGCPSCQGLAAARPVAAVQLKNCAYADWKADGMPLAYRAQVLWEAAVLGADRGYLAAFDRNAVTITVIEIPVDDAARRSIEVMLDAAGRFRDLVIRRIAPDPDGHPSTTEALKQQYRDIDPARTAVVPRRLAQRWFAAAAAEKRARAAKTRYLNQLLAAAGTAGQWAIREDGDIIQVATRSAAPRAGYWVEPSDRVDTVRPSRRWQP